MASHTLFHRAAGTQMVLPPRFSTQHLKLLRMGIVVYPGDEGLIQRLEDQATKVKTVITETDDDTPNKSVTTIEDLPVETGASMLDAKRTAMDTARAIDLPAAPTAAPTTEYDYPRPEPFPRVTDLTWPQTDTINRPPVTTQMADVRDRPQAMPTTSVWDNILNKNEAAAKDFRNWYKTDVERTNALRSDRALELSSQASGLPTPSKETMLDRLLRKNEAAAKDFRAWYETDVARTKHNMLARSWVPEKTQAVPSGDIYHRLFPEGSTRTNVVKKALQGIVSADQAVADVVGPTIATAVDATSSLLDPDAEVATTTDVGLLEDTDAEAVGFEAKLIETVSNITGAPPVTVATIADDTLNAATSSEKQLAKASAGAKDNKLRGEKPTSVQLAELNRVWGSYARNPAERKRKFMKDLNNVFAKAMLINAVANFTGGTSQADNYLKTALYSLQQMLKFDEEERLYNLFRSAYFTPDGKFQPPRSQKEAYETILRLGGSAEEASALFGYHPKDEQYYKDNGRGGWETIRSGSDPGEPWVKGTPSGKPPSATTITPSTTMKDISAFRQYLALAKQAEENGNTDLARRMRENAAFLETKLSGEGKTMSLDRRNVAFLKFWQNNFQAIGGGLLQTAPSPDIWAEQDTTINGRPGGKIFATALGITADDLRGLARKTGTKPSTRAEAQEILRAVAKPADVSAEDHEAAIQRKLDKDYPE